MAKTTQTDVYIRDTVEAEEIKRKGKIFFFFNTEWWEIVSTKTIGSEVHVKTDRNISGVFVNGVKYTVCYLS